MAQCMQMLTLPGSSQAGKSLVFLSAERVRNIWAVT